MRKEYAIFKVREGVHFLEEHEMMKDHIASITEARNYIRARRDAGNVNRGYEIWFFSRTNSMCVEEVWIDDKSVIYTDYVYQIKINGLPQGFLYTRTKSEEKRKREALRQLDRVYDDISIVTLRKLGERGNWI